jgi:hypothetical protein
VLLSRLIRLQPVGGAIDAVPERRASTEASSTSPLLVGAGRVTVRVDPNVLDVVMAPAGGKAL